MIALPWPKTADKLHERRSVWVSNAPVHINSHLIYSVDELKVKGVQKDVLVHSVLIH